VLMSVLMAGGLFVGPAAALAQAKVQKPQPVFHRNADYTSCVGVVAALAGGQYWAAALLGPECGVWLSGPTVNSICWESRQWWGAPDRALVRWITHGKESTC
jgi:hypothetical protein